MITRAQWGAKPLTAYSNKIEPSYRTGVVIHHSVTSEGRNQTEVEGILRMIDNLHRSKGYGGIGYNIAVDARGLVYNARGINTMGAHTAGANGRNYGIVYIGDGRKRITDKAIASIQHVIGNLQGASRKKLDINGHRELNSTTCPGDVIFKLIKAGKFDMPYPAVKPKYLTAKENDTYRKIAIRWSELKDTPANLIKITRETKRIRDLNNGKLVIAGQKVRVK